MSLLERFGGRLRAHNATVWKRSLHLDKKKRPKTGVNNHQKKEVSQPSFYTMNPTIGGILALVPQSNTAPSGQLKVVLFSAVKSQ